MNKFVLYLIIKYKFTFIILYYNFRIFFIQIIYKYSYWLYIRKLFV